MLTQNYLKTILNYNPITGDLIWKISKGRRVKKDQIAGWTTSRGYREVQIDGKVYQAHRVIWLLEKGSWPEIEIDHKDLVKSNNRLDNLRPATDTQNQMNRALQKNNKSGHKGVIWHKRDKRWYSYISVNKKHIWLGYYKEYDDAVIARKKAVSKYFGEYASLEES